MPGIEVTCLITLNAVALLKLSPAQSRALLTGVADMIDAIREVQDLAAHPEQAAPKGNPIERTDA